MSQRPQAVRGMHDILPQDTPLWQRLERELRQLLAEYHYREIRLPVIEKTGVFTTSIGQGTDVVEKEMYSFPDRNGDSLTLRPEGTAGCVRAMVQHGLLQGHAVRVWYQGPMFRYERPQKGRQRQFHQTGVELFGPPGPDADAELVLLAARLWRRLGLQGGLKLEINTLGNAESRAAYRQRLVAYFRAHESRLDEDSRRRLEINPLRILDSKNPEMQELIEQAPRITEALDEASLQHFNRFCAILDAAGITWHHNPRLVRGLDYYNHTVYEWVTDQLGAQSAVCSGGRYDGLVERFGHKPVPATGFAMGMERLMELLRLREMAGLDQAPHAYLVAVGVDETDLLPVAERMRDAMPGLRLECNVAAGSFKAQFKRADRSGAAVALVLGGDELAAGRITVKPLRGQAEQQSCTMEHLPELLHQYAHWKPAVDDGP